MQMYEENPVNTEKDWFVVNFFAAQVFQ